MMPTHVCRPPVALPGTAERHRHDFPVGLRPHMEVHAQYHVRIAVDTPQRNAVYNVIMDPASRRSAKAAELQTVSLLVGIACQQLITAQPLELIRVHQREGESLCAVGFVAPGTVTGTGIAELAVQPLSGSATHARTKINLTQNANALRYRHPTRSELPLYHAQGILETRLAPIYWRVPSPGPEEGSPSQWEKILYLVSIPPSLLSRMIRSGDKRSTRSPNTPLASNGCR